jgi:hypothetical protein
MTTARYDHVGSASLHCGGTSARRTGAGRAARWAGAALLAFAAIVVPRQASASAPLESADARVDHYEVVVPHTVEEAVAILGDRTDTLVSAWRSDDWAGVHEASYPLEGALERLRQSDSVDAQELATAAATLERVHLASEAEDTAVLDTDVPVLETQLRALAESAAAAD